MDELPEYMKYCYEALLKLYDEIEEELAKEGRAYRMPYAKETVSHTHLHIYLYKYIYLLMFKHIFTIMI